jgi:ankyrin repeat protein
MESLYDAICRFAFDGELEKAKVLLGTKLITNSVDLWVHMVSKKDGIALLLQCGFTVIQDNIILLQYSRSPFATLEEMQLFVKDKNWDFELENISLYTPIHSAMKNNKTDIVAYFIDHGATKGLQETLIAAAKNGNDKIIQMIFDKCIDRLPNNFVNGTAEGGSGFAGTSDDHKSYYGQSTALMFAAQYGHLSTVKLLIQHGADIHVRGNRNRTACEWAHLDPHDRSCKEVVEYLKLLMYPPLSVLTVYQNDESDVLKKLAFDNKQRLEACDVIKVKTEIENFMIFGENMTVVKMN